MTAEKSLRNVGIVAHVDAGKTTLTEQMLYASGQIRAAGRVDMGTTHTDWLDVERERGISVRAATTVFQWRGCSINLIDTPGHVDFSSEVERSLRILDGAVLMVSAAEGIQAHTETLWNALREMRIPTIIFINKLDRIGADPGRVMREIQKAFTPSAVPMQVVCGTEQAFEGVNSVLSCSDEALTENLLESVAEGKERILEILADHDDAVMEQYLNGESMERDEIEQRLVSQIQQCRMYPVLYGAAIQGIGVAQLMDAIVQYLPAPSGSSDRPLSGVVFKLERQKSMGKVAYVRLYNGTMKNRDAVYNATQDKEEKVTQIRKMFAQSHEDVGMVHAGDIAAVCGFADVKIGDILGSADDVPDEHRLTVPLLTVEAHPVQEAEYPRLVAALQELSEEDPLLDLQWLQDERELHIKITGTIQLEIMTNLLRSRFGIEAVFGQPSVIYKETPAKTGEGFIAYTMPKPCWAILRFLIEPGERGSGLVYSSRVRAEQLLPSYQNEVERRVPEALQQGLHGWEVTDLQVTLIEGEHHVWHTHPLDFVVATPMGIMGGLSQTGTTLLEPIIWFRIVVPEELGGKILSDLVQMRAQFDNPFTSGGRFAVEGKMPVAESLDYPVKLGSLTGGRGTMTTRFAGYEECPPELGAVRPRRGVNPLDRAKYILSVRNAL
jgi:translation elongation factor EF-G